MASGELKRDLERAFGVRIRRLECGPGWAPLVRRFLEDAREAGEPEVLADGEAKQKFGRLRFNFQGSPELRRLADALEAESAGICELCGGPGERRPEELPVATRCAPCRKREAEKYERLLRERRERGRG